MLLNISLMKSGNSKIENFIRTKYESKRWVMDGGMPDPSTLDDGDDDVVSALAESVVFGCHLSTNRCQ